ncbi:hypothetical protein [Burkholderia sp. PR2]|uniref:hypothetical protein n=1 Tax=Burkholderia sp. PR2 TaxID=3448078 RepID=UPI00402AC006
MPGAFVETADWPLLPSGKTDRNGFPSVDPAGDPVGRVAPLRAPSTPVERTLAGAGLAQGYTRAPVCNG